MIRLICTQCKAELMIDDAFAGGACRCQHCGTIQTVPKRFKGNADTGAGAPAIEPAQARARPAAEPKIIYQRQPGSEGATSSGIGRLASPKVAGSSSNATARGPVAKAAIGKAASPATFRPKQRWMGLPLPVLIGTVVGLLLIGVIVGMWLRK